MRAHFQTNEEDKTLFQKSLQFTCEAVSGVKKMTGKSDLINEPHQIAPSNSHLMFLPYRQIKPALEILHTARAQIK